MVSTEKELETKDLTALITTQHTLPEYIYPNNKILHETLYVELLQ